MALIVDRLDNVETFLAAAGDFLVRREAEHNLLFGISWSIRVSPEAFADDPPRFHVVRSRGRVVAASLRTPPNNQVLSMADDPEAVEALADALRDEALPGLLGPTDEAARFARRWSAVTGASAYREMAERIHRLERVVPPGRPASGAWRLVEPRDREVIARWIVDFQDEAVPGAPPTRDPLGVADRWVAGIGRTGYVWEVDAEVVSLAGAGGETPNGVRIGPVYTPPEQRSRGYATSLTAAATQDQLDRGRRFVFLFTDLANPTSNKIYRSIGYEPVCDVDQYRFDATIAS
ncbi:MAG TPA: GNAT family N-acetyltransferase [Candidatus Limnocylindria bacterium]